MPAADTAPLHALTQQCSRAIRSLFVGSNVADVAWRFIENLFERGVIGRDSRNYARKNFD